MGFRPTVIPTRSSWRNCGAAKGPPASRDLDSRLLIDAHGTPVADIVWLLYRRTLARIGPVPTLIEWDNDVPAFSVLAVEAARARKEMEAEIRRRQRQRLMLSGRQLRLPANHDAGRMHAGRICRPNSSPPCAPRRTASPCLKGAAQGRAERRFAVHRNTVAASLIEALAARFPVVERLVGEEFFRAMAHAYVMQEPPRSPLLFQFGGSFADFIARFAPAAPLPYLSDMARLEYAQGVAYHAADREPLAPASFAALDRGRLADFTVELHPSVFIVGSSHLVISIWLANQAETVTPLRQRGAEAALVSRPFLDVETRRLQPGTDAFLSVLKAGATIGEAVGAGEVASLSFSAAEALATLIGANIAVALGTSR